MFSINGELLTMKTQRSSSSPLTSVLKRLLRYWQVSQKQSKSVIMFKSRCVSQTALKPQLRCMIQMCYR